MPDQRDDDDHHDKHHDHGRTDDHDNAPGGDYNDMGADHDHHAVDDVVDEYYFYASPRHLDKLRAVYVDASARYVACTDSNRLFDARNAAARRLVDALDAAAGDELTS